MAITSGAGPHYAWVSINGQNFPLEGGSVSRTATRKSGSFSGEIPLWSPGLEETLATLGDNKASVIVQTRGQQATLMTGEIDMAEFDYVAGMVRISGRDGSAKLHAVKSAEKWTNKKPDEIIKDLAGRVGLSAQVDQSTTFAGRYVQVDWAKLTDGVSYAAVLHKMCEFMGWHWYVDKNGVLQVTSNQSQGSGPYMINFSYDPASGAIVSDCLRLQIRRNIQAGKPVKIKVNTWNQHEQKAYTGTHTIGGNGSTQEYMYHLPGLTQEHVDQHAKSKAKDIARHEIEVIAEVVGDPSIDIAQQLQLNGTAFSQTLTIDSITDVIGMKGHTTTIQAKSAKQGRASS